MGYLELGETFGDKAFDEVSIAITVHSVRMDEVESFGRMRQCIWLQAIPSTVDYLPLDLLLCKHMGSCNISLDVP